MAIVTLTLPPGGICIPNSNHYTLVMAGDIVGTKTYDIEKIKSFVDSVGPEEAVAVILRLAQIGRTPLQVRNLLQATITVIV